MKMGEYLGKGFIRAEHLSNGPERAVIANVEPGQYERPDLELQDGRKLGLNQTNLRTLCSAWGDESNDWIGKEIELYLGKTTFNNQDRESVLVRTISPRIPWRAKTGAPAGSQPRGKELDDEIPF